MAGLLSGVLFAITLQTHINGSNHAYATDVGELQNALPRWGTIHFSGYPLYSITGSLIVTLLRLVGVAPALGSSLVSLLWGALSVAVLARLALELGAGPVAALVGVLVVPVSTSMWIDASLAEVHTMTILFMVLTLHLAVRFDSTGDRRTLIWLAAVFGQGIFHGRSVVGLLPAVAVLVLPRWRMVWRNAPLLVGVGLVLPPLLYVYLPLREWMGSRWTFGNTSTWQGFWRMFLNIKAARFAEVEKEVVGWVERLRVALRLLRDDLPLVVHGAGLSGLLCVSGQSRGRWRTIAALILAVLPYMLVPVLIYAGFIGDAILAVKVPVSLFTGLGLALLVGRLQDWRPTAGFVALGLVVAAIAVSGWRNYPDVVEITRDRSVEEVIAIADQAANPEGATVLMVPWGRGFWGIAYAQAYRRQLGGVDLVDHNAPFKDIVARGDRLLTLSETFYVYPVGWWERKLGPIALETYAPGVIEIETEPRLVGGAVERFRVNEDLSIASGEVESGGNEYLIRAEWLAERAPSRDYSVAVHLVSRVPAEGPEDVLAQADSRHPVEGWYPTTRWIGGQAVQEVYRLEATEEGALPVAVRVTAYYVDEDGVFVNGEWLTLYLDVDES
ncbi:MAG: DUF2723 domain-containing protein [Anaerolineae bacterium]|jgi:hypothetical protein